MQRRGAQRSGTAGSFAPLLWVGRDIPGKDPLRLSNVEMPLLSITGQRGERFRNRAKERGAGEKAGKGIEILFLLRM